ncbi:metallopeptidase family protein [Candidatus Mycolicibacterium alkanivorans]|uniref:Metallopeptidase family protein n=1 Tax=Candidatus Mycolicibacterium alkanivorans TaxID=2954114 RepID=A0ABS9YSQ0_9MYCO|nr:metallopeptidase family protein [Candidatus Mycolicibacterium alkanivorans]MCI4674231.1 metallopeptidase family protein [Candidatus Mycolicibacterium alkanivorans]
MPVSMTPQRFEELVSDALDLIPPELAAAIDNVVVLVEDRHPDDPELLGLYEGIALTERDSMYAGALPDTITIYRESLLEICDTEANVVEEVAITVIHEIAHHFGIDDDRLHELGWG